MLHLTIKDPKSLSTICHALSTELRLDIIRLLQRDTVSCLELSRRLGVALSTIASNVRVLEDAGLVSTALVPAKNGSKKMCSLAYLDVSIQLAPDFVLPQNTSHYQASVSVGNYMDFDVAPSCGLVVFEGNVLSFPDGHFDDPNFFLDPSRLQAQLLWFRCGYVEYRVPLGHDARPLGMQAQSISFSLELCSEAPGANLRWRSDITMWINGVEIGTWTCPSDFGDRRGLLTPREWLPDATQYGILTEWTVDEAGSHLNHEALSDITIDALHLDHKHFVTMRIGVKPTSENVGGINIFGEAFGDYPQAIVMTIRYKPLK